MKKKKLKKIKKKVKKIVKKEERKISFFLRHKRRFILYGVGIFIILVESTALFLLLAYRPQTPQILDSRPGKIDNYFAKNNMPLAGYGETFVRAADKCDMDWRLLPAIAVRESSGGKHMQYNNPFGWGGAQIKFDNIDDAIYALGDNLCGHNTSTAKWYSTTSTYEKLYRYNGTVVKKYPAEVMWIMDQF